MSKTSGFKYSIIWTACYIAVMWVILRYLFNFNMFLLAHWAHIIRGHYTGFAGFVFVILLLAAVPMYIATTMMIMRRGEPLFSSPIHIKMPSFIKRFFAGPERTAITTPIKNNDAPAATPPAPIAPESAPEPATTAPTPAPAPAPDDPAEYPADMPTELRAQFARARNHVGRGVTSAINRPATIAPPAADATSPLPLPTDFDVPAQSPVAAPETAAPMFTDINFDTPTDAPAPATDTTQPADEYNADVLEYLKSHGRDATVTDGIVVTGDMAIASHTDTSFWIADDDVWFAAGRTRPSPVVAVARVAAAGGLSPVLYLGADNIMDLESRRTEWESNGIRIITSLDELG